MPILVQLEAIKGLLIRIRNQYAQYSFGFEVSNLYFSKIDVHSSTWCFFVCLYFYFFTRSYYELFDIYYIYVSNYTHCAPDTRHVYRNTLLIIN